MNTNDIKFNGEIKSFDDLFKFAREQFLNYEKIEGINDWEAYDFSIDCSEDQMKFKDMLQIRFIEELTEASIAMDENEPTHFWEEITDALNFFLSAYVMLGVDFKKFPNPEDYLYNTKYGFIKMIPSDDIFSLWTYPVIEAVGYLCNLLKNRPWTESNYLVSMYDFNNRLEYLWEKFWCYLNNFYLSPADIFEMFYKKFKVNEVRRDSNY